MHRLFVAIRPPHQVRSLLIATMGGISGARWQNDDQLHLTLRFIGEVDRHLAGDILAALGSIHHPRFELSLNGIGTFDRRGHPDAVWAGVAPHAPLKALHKKVDQAIARVGVAPDERAYLPHITLARLKRGAGTVGNFLEQSGGVASAPFTVDHFSLYESKLTPDGAVYTIVERFPLD
jgi:2'-5' RNA ligase